MIDADHCGNGGGPVEAVAISTTTCPLSLWCCPGIAPDMKSERVTPTATEDVNSILHARKNLPVLSALVFQDRVNGRNEL